MVSVIVFCALSGGAFAASIVLCVLNKKHMCAACLTAAYIAAFVAVCIGVDFSPSFTVIFAAVCQALVISGEGVRAANVRNVPIFRVVSIVLSVIGVLFTFPSVYIYEVGDDWLQIYCGVAAAAGIVICALISFLKRKKRCANMAVYVSERVELTAFSIAAVFTLLSGITSLSLIPYGLGLVCLTASRCVENKLIRNALTYFGIVLTAAFVVAPMIF